MAEIIWDSDVTWPGDWPETVLQARFVNVTGDGPDAGSSPDIAPARSGDVYFTPSVRNVRYVGVDGPYLASLHQYRGVVDSDGYLCTPDQYGQPGERGIVLPSTDAQVIEPRGEEGHAFTWRVDFDIPGVTISRDYITAPSVPPVDATHYDLIDLLHVEKQYGVVHVIDRVSAREAISAAEEATAARDLVLPARDQTLAARDQAVAAADALTPNLTRIRTGEYEFAAPYLTNISPGMYEIGA